MRLAPLFSTAPALHPAFLGVGTDEATLQLLRQMAREQGWPETSVLQGGLSAVEALPLSDGVPQVLVLDLDEEADPLAGVARIRARLGRGGRLIALGSANDVDLFRRLIGAGVADYLVKPVAAEVLRAALTMPVSGPAPAPGAAPVLGKVCVVIGVRGGVGASTIAVNAAWLMAHEFRLNTALLDLDLQFGTSALSLDLEPGRGLREVLEAPDRLDPLLLTGCMVAESERLCVLGAEESVEDGLLFDTQALAALIRELRGTFSTIVVDMPRHLVPRHRRLLAGAESVTLVSDLSLAGIRDTVRLTQAIQGSAGTVRLLTVASRVGKDRKPQVDRATFERSINGSLAVIVPEDPRAVADAANQGKALGAAAKGAAVTLSLRDLAKRMAAADAPPKPNLLAKLLRRKS